MEPGPPLAAARALPAAARAAIAGLLPHPAAPPGLQAGQDLQASLIDGDRLHLHQGPIDVVISADGPDGARDVAYAAAIGRFHGLLEGLVAELPLLRRPLPFRPSIAAPVGPVARRMLAAALPFSGRFRTPMIAVAGAVADELLAAMRLATDAGGLPLRRAVVNDGGDIAVHIAPGERVAVGVVSDLARAVPDGRLFVAAHHKSRGIATSGRHGRSFSLGIADAATVLARDAATADAAATLVANAVTVDHPAITRQPAQALDPDSDLGTLLVTTTVGALPAEAVESALAAGAAEALRLLDAGLIDGALIALAGHWRAIGAAQIHTSAAITCRASTLDPAITPQSL